MATYSGSWWTRELDAPPAGTIATPRGPAPRVTFRFTGRAVAIVAPKGPTRGSAKVYVDGVYVGTVNLHRSSIAAAGRRLRHEPGRRAARTRSSWSSSGPAATPGSTSTRSRPALDALGAASAQLPR